MVEVRACIYFSVIFLCFHVVTGKPMFGLVWCDLFCEEDDPTTTTTASDYWDDALCGGCFLDRPTTTTPNPALTTMNPASPGIPGGPGGPGGPGQPFNLMIPPANGMNLTMWRPGDGGSWWLNLVPWGSGNNAGGPPPGAMPTTPSAAATTAAAAATTAAGEATTAAPTTAAPAAK